MSMQYQSLLNEMFMKIYDKDDKLEYHKNVLARVLKAVLQEEKLSLAFLKELHQIGLNQLNEAALRTNPVITPIPENITENAVLEFIRLLKNDKTGFEEGSGIYIGPMKEEKISPEGKISKNSLSQEKRSEEASAKDYHGQMMSVYYPVSGNNNKDAWGMCRPAEELEGNINRLIGEYEGKISTCVNDDQKINLIVSLVQTCLRIFPFDDGNHRVFVLGMLNFLLIKEGIGVCALKDRQQFVFNDLTDGIKEVKKNLKNPSFCENKYSQKLFCLEFLNHLYPKKAQENQDLFKKIYDALLESQKGPKRPHFEFKASDSPSVFWGKVGEHTRYNGTTRSAQVLNLMTEFYGAVKKMDSFKDVDSLGNDDKFTLFKLVHQRSVDQSFWSRTHLKATTFDELKGYVETQGNEDTRSAKIYRQLFQK